VSTFHTSSTFVTAPTRPSSIICFSRRLRGAYLTLCATRIDALLSRSAASIARTCSQVAASGFSVTTPIPARSADTAYSA
jgi:hypothetical protein